MSNEEAIRISGLTEFRKQLRELDKELPKALRVAFNEAADGTVEAARRQVPRRTGRAAASLRTKSTQKYARASGGSARAPYYPWLDFGGSVGRDGSVHRPFFKNGRYLYNSYFRRRDSGEFERDLQKALLSVALRAGLDVK